MLKCLPSVYVIGNDYEICFMTKKNGISYVNVAGKRYDEENSGVLFSEKNYYKIRIPQKVLDKHKKYEIVYIGNVNRQTYFTKGAEPQTYVFNFKPITKTEDINVYHLADVHQKFELAKKSVTLFKNDLDLLVINGDIAEVTTTKDYYDVYKFVGELSKGEIPVIFVRGNHDCRGKLAEKFTDYFPCNGKKLYYDFKVGPLKGVVVDCGEDKVDFMVSYGPTNHFTPYRKEQTKFLKKLKGDYFFAIGHVCPTHTTNTKGSEFDIERDIYKEWTDILQKLNIKFFLTGHFHRERLIPANSGITTIPNPYPILVGSGLYDKENIVISTAMTIKKDCTEVIFTASDNTASEKQIIMH